MGDAFDVEIAVDNLSGVGLYTFLSRCVDPGARMFFVFRIPLFGDFEETGMQFVARALVRRVEQPSAGKCWVGVEFGRYRQV